MGGEKERRKRGTDIGRRGNERRRGLKGCQDNYANRSESRAQPGASAKRAYKQSRRACARSARARNFACNSNLRKPIIIAHARTARYRGRRTGQSGERVSFFALPKVRTANDLITQRRVSAAEARARKRELRSFNYSPGFRTIDEVRKTALFALALSYSRLLCELCAFHPLLLLSAARMRVCILSLGSLALSLPNERYFAHLCALAASSSFFAFLIDSFFFAFCGRSLCFYRV